MLSVGPTPIQESIKASINVKTKSTNMLVQAFYTVHDMWGAPVLTNKLYILGIAAYSVIFRHW